MFKLSYVCDLLERLQAIARHDPPYNTKELHERSTNELVAWFKSYRKVIDALDAHEASALLSTLLPHKRKDRVYGIQSASLVKILGRCLGLNASRRQDLERYKAPGNGDLPDCLERVLRHGGPPALPPVTLLEVDQFLQYLAGQCRFSAEHIQAPPSSSNDREERLRHIMLRMTATEAKWVARFILKDLAPAILAEFLTLRLFHFLIADLLHVHNDLCAATRVLKETFKNYPSQPDPQSRVILRQTAAASLRPIPGVMVSRSDFCKARSIKQCLQMAAGQKWMVDRKYDGEYCQIHIDLRKGTEWIKIFSKSGRDSTQDREGLHNTIRRCLRIGSDRCQIKYQCILVGEMVVYNEADKCILGFDKIRKHIPRAGVFLGAEQDSPAHPDEHLMVVFFDLLLLDDENLLNQPVEHRRKRLSKIYKKLDGRAQAAESTVLDFGLPDSKRKLIHQFAASNALRHEGLVLKPCGVPYFTLPASNPTASTASCSKMIKLKKDYISGLGDEADFAVIGASYNSQEANKRPELGVSWTHFHLGCLMNEIDVDRFQVEPIFKYVGTISMDQCIPAIILQQINAEGKFLAERPSTTFKVNSDHRFQPDTFFRNPFVFEVLGSSYSRPSGCGFYMLRHPRVTKLHSDRNWRDCITFDQLQEAAQEALAVPGDAETQENLDWISRLESSCKQKFAHMSCNTTPLSARSVPTPRNESSERRRKHKDHDLPPIYVDDPQTSPLAEVTGRRSMQMKTPLTDVDQNISCLPTPPTSSPLNKKSSVPENSSRKRPVTLEPSLTGNKRHKAGYELKAMRTGSECQPLANKMESASRSTIVSRATCAEEASETLEDTLVKKAQEGALLGTPRRNMMNAERTAEGFHGPSHASNSSTTLFQNTVVYVDETIATAAELRSQVLGMDGTSVVGNVQHWDRDCFAFAPLTDTVSESQAYSGSRKVVLVDSEQGGQLDTVLQKLLGLNKGVLQEDIQVYDYRVMGILDQERNLGGGDKDTTDEESCLMQKQHAIGIVSYDAAVGRSIFRDSQVGSSAETTGKRAFS